jgi:hypothetical protein
MRTSGVPGATFCEGCGVRGLAPHRRGCQAVRHIEQTPRSAELDGALGCEGGDHVWRVSAEDASPEPWQTCACGARRWNTERERILTGLRSSAT